MVASAPGPCARERACHTEALAKEGTTSRHRPVSCASALGEVWVIYLRSAAVLLVGSRLGLSRLRSTLLRRLEVSSLLSVARARCVRIPHREIGSVRPMSFRRVPCVKYTLTDVLCQGFLDIFLPAGPG
jgi:hypothetical protein